MQHFVAYFMLPGVAFSNSSMTSFSFNFFCSLRENFLAPFKREVRRFRIAHDSSSKQHNISWRKIQASDVNIDVLLEAKEVGNSSNSLLDHA